MDNYILPSGHQKELEPLMQEIFQYYKDHNFRNFRADIMTSNDGNIDIKFHATLSNQYGQQHSVSFKHLLLSQNSKLDQGEE